MLGQVAAEDRLRPIARKRRVFGGLRGRLEVGHHRLEHGGKGSQPLVELLLDLANAAAQRGDVAGSGRRGP